MGLRRRAARAPPTQCWLEPDKVAMDAWQVYHFFIYSRKQKEKKQVTSGGI
jgi:hypothetical protein